MRPQRQECKYTAAERLSSLACDSSLFIGMPVVRFLVERCLSCAFPRTEPATLCPVCRALRDREEEDELSKLGLVP